MTTPFDSRPTAQVSPWTASTENRTYLVAAMRAAAISVVLLAVLAFLVLL